ncbi:uncharacterized protein LOC105701229 [Orussus abietinus]|uniref:uncharacterized protein LOC105701229 n=1 Tax=Orussus abietinus TaxID=222816 RepID=UPI0006256AE3|nr:uncharacterized protein LOC105701229 [Orussus abietinus]XP_012283221.1 uncharacterized protein LOC105701229 [Orussus abietinus]XP_012283222.1 uncharacterized protein LOC105701229 [Orussus abietinus]XP_012283223.1 uncharacterized protein LOC105701229 [Orussus abietinus]
MSSTKEDIDINEAFDNLLFAEDIAERSGYEEGYKVGRVRIIDGYHLGYHRGSTLAAQLGYYSGIIELCLLTKHLPDKVTCLAKKLLEEINNFPKFNSDTLDILNIFENIKFQYIKFCSLAKINATYPDTDKLDF